MERADVSPACLEPHAGRQPIELVPIPKPGRGTRWLAALGPVDRTAYARIVGGLSRAIERVLGPEVLANRTVPGPALALESWRIARRRFLRARNALRDAPAVLQTDVRDCYGSIGPSLVEASVRSVVGPSGEVTALRRLLESFEARGVRGLPVGPEPSAVLANAVLATMDRALAAERLRHVRWVDDVWAAAPSRPAAERALDRLQESLQRVGLALAEEKTRVVERGGDPGLEAPSGLGVAVR